MTRQHVAAFGIVIGCLAGVAAAANHNYYHFKDAVPLGLDVTMIAVFDEGGSPAAPGDVLASVGVDTSMMSPSTVPGWTYVETTRSLHGARQIGSVISRLAAEGEFDFVSPVFAGESGLPYIPTRDLLVMRSAGSDAEAAEAVLSSHGDILDTDFAGMNRLYRVRTSLRDGRDVLAAANSLAVMDMFEFAESDAIAWVRGNHIPNDPEFGQQWGLHQSNDHDMDAPEAWDISMGSEDIVVVVLDSGIDQAHPDIHQLTGQTFTGSGSNGNPSTGCDNHGTAVGGCVAATIDNGQGVTGIAPHCWVRAGKVFNEMDLFGFCLGFLEFQESWVVSGINWVEDTGARVTNSSWGGGSPMSSITSAFNSTRAAGVFHVGAAGNDGSTTIGWPANLSSVVAVAAMSSNGTLASFSTHGSGLFISAPGEGIRTTDRSGSAGYGSGNTTTIDGTSFASPYTAGVAGLVLSVDPSLSPDELEDVLSSTAVDYGSNGYDTNFGHGFVNAQSALESVDTGEECLGDLDGDAMVGVKDLLVLISQWGSCGGCSGDLDDSGAVNVKDMLALISAWGTCP